MKPRSQGTTLTRVRKRELRRDLGAWIAGKWMTDNKEVGHRNGPEFHYLRARIVRIVDQLYIARRQKGCAK